MHSPFLNSALLWTPCSFILRWLDLNSFGTSSSCFYYFSWQRKIHSQLRNLPKIDSLSEAEFHLLMTNYPWKRGIELWSICPSPQSFPPPSFRSCVSSPSALHASKHKPYWHGSSSTSGCVFCFETSLSLPLWLYNLALCVCSLQLLTLECLFHSMSPLYNGIFQIAIGEMFHDFSTCLYVADKQSVARYCFRFRFCQHLASTGWSYNIQLDGLELTIRGCPANSPSLVAFRTRGLFRLFILVWPENYLISAFLRRKKMNKSKLCCTSRRGF